MADDIITNSFDHAVTRNHNNQGRRYFYRINPDGALDHARGADGWNMVIPAPDNTRIVNVAADNNRVFIMAENLNTHEKKLYWKTMHEDSASWVLLIFFLAEQLGKTEARDLIWTHLEGKTTINGVSYDDLEDWANAYQKWVITSHIPDHWNTLENRDLTGKPGTNHHDIIDIAVGNWEGAVVTYYILARSHETEEIRLYYLDEEPIMQEWERVHAQPPESCNENSRICASHSVIAVTVGNKIHWVRWDAHHNGHIPFFPLNWNEIWWGVPNDLHGLIRDTVNWPEDLVSLLPIDTGPPWDIPLGEQMPPPIDFLAASNYPGWHTVEADVDSFGEFHIDVGYKNEPWPVPKPPVGKVLGVLSFFSPAWQFYFKIWALSAIIDAYRNTHSEVGVLGENSMKPNWHYPICCVIKRQEQYFGFSIKNSASVNIDNINWEEIGTSSWIRGILVSVCNETETRLNDCEDWVTAVFECESKTEEECRDEQRRRKEGCLEYECHWLVPDLVCDASRGVCQLWNWVAYTVCVVFRISTSLVCTFVRHVTVTVCKIIFRPLMWASCWARRCWEDEE